MKKWLVLSFSFFTSLAFAQVELQLMRDDMNYLASDELEGRGPGTPGIAEARDYILDAFEYALDSSWMQRFPIPEPMLAPADGNSISMFVSELYVSGEKVDNDVWVTVGAAASAYPVRYSSNGEAKGKLVRVGFGITSPEMEHDDYKDVDVEGKIAVIDISSPDGVHPHSQYLKYHGLDYRIANAVEHGAIGVIFIKEDETSQAPRKSFNSALPGGIPALYLPPSGNYEFLDGESEFKVKVELVPQSVEGENVIGILNRGKEKTLVIGAHYDHLGYGGQNSLYRGEKAIHNGADDNASGTTGLLHLVRMATDIAPDFNLVFIAFSGEERGLLGSDYFTEQPYFETLDIVAMLNMDMIGRLDEDKAILISGTGTAAEWDDIIAEQNTYGFDVKSSAGGTGASDHTSFYQKDIPVLHFFTGTHEDYHKPSDDIDKINFEGLQDVANYLVDIANAIPSDITFQRTAEESQSTPRFNVTLGIIPDYVFGGPGVKVDGVTEGKPASKAGLEAGDIIMKLGEYPTTDIYGYMKALGAFQPGQTTTVTVNRGEEELEYELTF
ncbi:MAG: M28 family peptidase [Flavobacteriia bacterium]|nr:M28 family peptidase [Flavobacteriia bacterium]